MDWDRKRFTIGAEIEVLATWVHTLVASASYHITTAITTGAMYIQRDRRKFEICRFAEASKAMTRMLSRHDRVTRRADVEIWAVQAFLVAVRN